MNADMIPDAELAEIEKRNRERTQGADALTVAIEEAAKEIAIFKPLIDANTMAIIINRHLEPVVSELNQQIADLHKSVADSVEHCQDGWRQAAMLSDESERLRKPLSAEAVERFDKHAEKIAETLEQVKEPR